MPPMAKKKGFSARSLVCPNQEFYWGLVVLRVENELFRVAKELFTESPFFQGQFRLNRDLEHQEKWAMDDMVMDEKLMPDEIPIVLSDIGKEEFTGLLMAMTRHRSTTPESWVSALKLASKWDLHNIRAAAVETLATATLPPFTRIQLAQEYGIQEWVLIAYKDLAARTETLTMEEAKLIGLEATVTVFHAREKVAALKQ